MYWRPVFLYLLDPYLYLCLLGLDTGQYKVSIKRSGLQTLQGVTYPFVGTLVAGVVSAGMSRVSVTVCGSVTTGEEVCIDLDEVS